jgi:hypothetical protein
MPTAHGFCSLHRIGYLRSLDATCPQCTQAGVSAKQLDYDPNLTVMVAQAAGGPVDASGKAIDLESIVQP